MAAAEATTTTTLTEETVLRRSKAPSLAAVRHLTCYGLGLRDVSIVAQLTSCETLSLVGNGVVTLAPFASYRQLMELFLRGNRVASLQELRHLEGLRLLHTLWLSD